MVETKLELLEKEYKKQLAQYLQCGAEQIFLYWKGRVALYAILKAMGVKPGDEVILQSYTCVVVANAILYLGATPVYVDIDEDTYNMNIDLLESKITNKTKVIICQNTYGLSSNLEIIMAIAKEHGIFTVEDCTHGFGGYYNGKPNGSYCDASFFSTQWSKPFTTGIGGFSVIHNEGLRDIISNMENDKIKPSKKESMNLRALYFARKYIINDFTYWPMVKLYRLLSKYNFVVGSSSGEEIRSPEIPVDYFKGISDCQMKKGLKALGSFENLQVLRKENSEVYTDFLENNNKNHIDRSYFDNHIFLRYPLLVKNRVSFKEAAIKEKIILGEWFDTPLYPVYDRMEDWKFDRADSPISQKICSSVVNLETDIKDSGKVIDFLKRNIDYIV